MRFITILFIAIMASVGLMAQTAIAPAVGGGTEGNPYEIAILENLYWIAADNDVVPNPDQAARWSSHYIQTADIDASETSSWFGGQGWKPIGYYYEWYDYIFFDGTYDGDGYTISNLFINRPDYDNQVGLFGSTGTGSELINLGLVDNSITGNDHVGGLAGDNSGTVTNCYSSGNVTGSYGVGGLVGINRESINDSYSTGDVTGANNTSGGLVGWNGDTISNSYATGNVSGEWYIGGLVGVNNHGTISNCYATGNLSGENNVGGLIGWNTGNNSLVDNCYATGSVSRTDGMETNFGGFVGQHYYGIISNCYSIGSIHYENEEDPTDKGFAAIVLTAIDNNYWDIDTSGQTTSAGHDGVHGRTTDEMTYPYAANTYAGWDFVDVWAADMDYEINSGYPYLKVHFPIIPPLSTIPVNPENEAINVPIDLSFEWSPNPEPDFPIPDGYMFGYWVSGEEPTLDDIGNVTEQFVEGLLYETDYEWQVVPYIISNNDSRQLLSQEAQSIITRRVERRSVREGDSKIYAEDCPVWSFSTIMEPVEVPEGGSFIIDYGEYSITIQPQGNITIIIINPHLPDNLPSVLDHIFSFIITGAGSFIINVQTNAQWGFYYQNDSWLPEAPGIPNINGIIEFNIDFGREGGVVLYGGNEPDTPLPVELSSFTASVTANQFVEMKWTTETETNLLGYNIYRAEDNELDDAERINHTIISSNNSSTTTNYSYIDENVYSGDTYHYWLQSVDLDLTSHFYGPVSINLSDEDDIPDPVYVTALQNNYPNPFNPETVIQYSLRDDVERTELKIYNIRGQLIRTLIAGIPHQKGEYGVTWDGKNDFGRPVTSGIYFYRMTTPSFDQINKMLLMK